MGKSKGIKGREGGLLCRGGNRGPELKRLAQVYVIGLVVTLGFSHQLLLCELGPLISPFVHLPPQIIDIMLPGVALRIKLCLK